MTVNRISKNRLTDQRTERIRSVAALKGQVVRRKFLGNVAYDTPLEDIYGGNVQRLEGLKQGVDPQNVTGLEGSSFDELGIPASLDLCFVRFFPLGFSVFLFSRWSKRFQWFAVRF